MTYRTRSDLSLLVKIVLGLIAVLLVLAIVETVLGLLFGSVSWFLGLFGPLGPVVALVGLLIVVLWAMDSV